MLFQFYLTLLWAALSSLLGSQFFPTSNYGCLLTGIGTWLFSAYFFLAPMQKRVIILCDLFRICNFENDVQCIFCKQNQRFWFLMTASYCMWAFITPFLSYWLGVESRYHTNIVLYARYIRLRTLN